MRAHEIIKSAIIYYSYNIIHDAFVLTRELKMDLVSCIQSKRKIVLYFALSALIVLTLYAVVLQTSHSAASAAVYLVDVDPAGVFDALKMEKFAKNLRSNKIAHMQVSTMGKWAIRKKLNRLVTLSNGERVFIKVRYGYPKFQGELMSYYLNCYLQMWNVPPTALACVNTSTREWINLTHPFSLSHGEFECFIATMYVEGLSDNVHIPNFLGKGIGLETISTTPRELGHLMEWSDMILFDYLCGHDDRLVNHLLVPHIDFQVPLKSISNLVKTSSGDLVLIDNEKTFHKSYSSARSDPVERSRQLHYLRSVSVFRKQTVERVCQLCSEEDPALTIEEYININDPVSLLIVSKLLPEDRCDFKKRLSHICNLTCHLLSPAQVVISDTAP